MFPPTLTFTLEFLCLFGQQLLNGSELQLSLLLDISPGWAQNEGLQDLQVIVTVKCRPVWQMEREADVKMGRGHAQSLKEV